MTNTMININGREIEATGIDSAFKTAFKAELKEHLERYLPYIVRATLLKHDTGLSVFEDEEWVLGACKEILENI